MSDKTEVEHEEVEQMEQPQNILPSPYDRVVQWNSICGKNRLEIGTQEYFDALTNQLSRIKEELVEFVDEVEKQDYNNLENMLKEFCDVLVTVYGAGYMLGLDVIGAMHKVLDNNDTKFTHRKELADETIRQIGARDYDIYVTYMPVHLNEGSTEDDLIGGGYTTKTIDEQLHVELYTVHRKSDDKICKLANHKSMNLEEFVPDTKNH